MNTLDAMGDQDYTACRLFSGSVKNFELYKAISNTNQEFFGFGFSLKKGELPKIITNNESSVYFMLERKGLDSLIDFLNRLREEIGSEDDEMAQNTNK